jgi:hypothetical protein
MVAHLAQGYAPLALTCFRKVQGRDEASWPTFARGFGETPADTGPLLDNREQWQARIDGALHLMQHELKLTPATLILALSPCHTPRGKTTPRVG